MALEPGAEMNIQMSFASATAFALLHSLWQLALIALLAALSFTALSGATARARHAVGMAWLLAMLAAPLLTFAQYWHSPAQEFAASLGGWALPGSGEAVNPASPPVIAPWWGWLLVCLSQVWLLGVVLMAVRQVGGWRLMRQIERQPFAELPAAWQQRVAHLGAALGITRQVSVRLAQRVSSPFTAHALRPLIWLPLGMLTKPPVAQVEALLAHELAHIARLDWCWNALQCAAEALLFHHPAMWWLSRRIREEREHACDDLAVAVSGDAIALAEALAGLQRRSARAPFAMPGLAAGGGALMKRISHLLSGAPARPNWRIPGAFVLLLCSASLVALQIVPPAHLLTNLRVDASSQGELAPGNYREYTANYLGEKQRHYRISMAAQGQVTEVYTEDGPARPVDGEVRHWLHGVTAMDATTQAPQAQRARTPAQASASEESTALMATISADPRLIALTGLPVSFDRASFHGSIHSWGARDFHLWGIDDPVGGTAKFTMTLEGPTGRVRVAYAGHTASGGLWTADALEFTPLLR